MKTKIKPILCFMLVLTMFVGIASALTLQINLTQGATYSDNITIAVQFTSNGTAENATEPVLFGFAADTNISTASALYNGSPAECNINGSVSGCNFSFRTNSTEDSSNWAFYVVARNGTLGSGAYTTATVSSITIDNTQPNTPASLSPAADASQESGDVTFTSNVTRNVTTHGYIEFKGLNPGKTRYSDTAEATSGQLSIALTDIPDGFYEWRYVASDGTQENASAYRTLQITGSSSSGKAVQQQAAIASQQASETSFGTILIVGIIGFALWQWNKKKK